VTRLPIDSVLPDIVQTLSVDASVVVQAPTGAGKTTRIPPALLDAGLAGSRRIIMLEPRRLAARAAAGRMTAERGGQLGDEIGYQVRFERRHGPRTRILVVTEGILVRMLQDDPFLDTAGLVIFDEFHERSLDNDLALGMVRRVQQTVRPDLRVVVMSATLGTEALAAYLDGCPILTSEGRQHPVDITYEPRSLQVPWPRAAADAVERLLDRTDGDVLVFLPGLHEIRQTARHLEKIAQERDLLVVPLYGDLPSAEQDRALLPQERRRIVLATNVAETSVTVEGITVVVDIGLARMLTLDPRLGLDRLQLTPISRASTDQRAGRAGRTRPGICVRLWTEASHHSRAEETAPEIRRVDLAGTVLRLWCWGETDIMRFPWLEKPPEPAVNHALALLRRLEAIDDRGVTDLGRLLARLPVHPRIARLLVEGWRWGQPERAALAAALLSERDPFARHLPLAPDAPEAKHRDRDRRRLHHATPSDVLDRVEALEEFERSGRRCAYVGEVNRSAARFIFRARDQLLRLLWQEKHKPSLATSPATPTSSDEPMLRSLLAAFPDRVARRRQPGSRQGVMVGRRGVRLAPGSGVTEPELFVCIDVDAGHTEAIVRQASLVRRDWLSDGQVRAVTEVGFDPVEERLFARRRLYYHDLVLEESPALLPDDDASAQVLATAAGEHLERVLPPEDSAAGRLLIRLRCLRHWLPELGLPAFDDNELREMLTWLCHGCRSFADLRQADWLGAIHARLTPLQRQTLEREAPEHLLVPSGSRLTLRYEAGRPPILAVRIQEMFGLKETPRIAAGRVAVLLHLLAPNNRPQQITDDLASFWANTYAQVRKELRARYPKHAWPEDPRSALAERRPRRKK
jgi:ATP-dependent helicase HrpB